MEIGCTVLAIVLVIGGLVSFTHQRPQAIKSQPYTLSKSYVPFAYLSECDIIRTAPTRKLDDKNLAGYFRKDFKALNDQADQRAMMMYHGRGWYPREAFEPKDAAVEFVAKIRKLQKDGLL